MDGIMDAAILVVYEGRMRPKDKYVESFVTYQREKYNVGWKSSRHHHPNIVMERCPIWRNCLGLYS